MSAKASIQDDYLRKLIATHTSVKLVLTNGKELRGQIKGCDAFTVILDYSGVELLVYKSAIAVLGPQGRGNE
ncbi:MAG: RNA chaperone Hfq [Armatimonadota bacterium]